MKRYLPGLLVLSGLLVASGCDQKPASQPTSQRPNSLSDGKVVAEINDQKISESLVRAFASSRGEDSMDDAGRAQLIKDLINLELLAQNAETTGLAKKPEIATQLMAQYYTTLARAAAQAHLEANPITDADIKKSYDEWAQKLPTKEFKASHILVKDKANADKILAKIQGGESFEEWAKKESIDPSGKEGGDLGWFNLQQMVKPFSDAVAELSPGQISKAAVQTNFGWHIIKLSETRDTQPPNMDSMRGELTGMVQSQKVTAYMEELKQKAKVTINEEALKAATTDLNKGKENPLDADASGSSDTMDKTEALEPAQ